MPLYTPTQRRLMAVLEDGLPHSRDELFACIDDELCQIVNFRVHLNYLRKKLQPIGLDILLDRTGDKPQKYNYRLVRLIAR